MQLAVVCVWEKKPASWLGGRGSRGNSLSIERERSKWIIGSSSFHWSAGEPAAHWSGVSIARTMTLSY